MYLVCVYCAVVNYFGICFMVGNVSYSFADVFNQLLIKQKTLCGWACYGSKIAIRLGNKKKRYNLRHRENHRVLLI